MDQRTTDRDRFKYGSIVRELSNATEGALSASLLHYNALDAGGQPVQELLAEKALVEGALARSLDVVRALEGRLADLDRRVRRAQAGLPEAPAGAPAGVAQ